MEFNFINPGHITMTFNTVAIMGEEFEINMFGEVSHLSRSQALSPISHRSVRHTKIVVTKRACDEMTGYLFHSIGKGLKVFSRFVTRSFRYHYFCA